MRSLLTKAAGARDSSLGLHIVASHKNEGHKSQ